MAPGVTRVTLLPGTRLGRYEVLAPLGAGGMGEVYRAHDTLLDRPVALKLLAAAAREDPRFRERFAREARAVLALNHPNVLTVYDVGELDGVPFIAAELVAGSTLRERLAGGPLPLAEALEIALQAAAALVAAETAGLVHRDIKPENLMLRPDGYLKVLDFGLVKSLTLSGAPAGTATLPELLVGTVPYMSPEQLRGEPLDARSDVWSLGVVLYEMLAGERPFAGATPSDQIASILCQPLPPLEQPPEIESLLRRLLARDRADRPGARALYAELEELRLRRRSRDGSLWPTQELPTGALATTVGAPSGDWGEIADALARARGRSPRSISAEAVYNLPAQPTSFLGREEETEALAALLGSPQARWVTLTGPGGTGKTRLALHVAERQRAQFADGVCFVALATVTDPQLVLASVAGALGLQDKAGLEPAEQLAQHLAGRSLLLVLDNFEHVAAASPDVARLLESAPRLKILVTSRQVLRVRAEHEYAVPALPLPDAAAAPDADRIASSPAVQLFEARARAVRSDFALTPANATAVAAICRRLDGLPLAIELAAARVKLLTPEAMLGRLESRLGLLSVGAADVPPRQRTLRSAIEWGYALLTAAERRLFARLAVFRGGIDLDAAEAVCFGEPGLDLDPLEGIGSLVDKSFLRREDRDGPASRFVMIDTLREYAEERLAESPAESAALRRRHARHFAELAGAADPALRGRRPAGWLARLEREQDNLRAALESCLELGDVALGLRLGGSLWRFWYLHGQYAEGRRWLRELLERADEAPPADRLAALIGAGGLAFLQCDYRRAEELLERSRAVAEELGDERRRAEVEQILGSAAREQGHCERAIACHRRSLEIFTRLGDELGAAHSSNYIGFASWLRADFSETERVCEQTLAAFRRAGDPEGTAWSLLNLGAAATHRGLGVGARGLLKEALVCSSEVGFKEGVAWALDLLGNLALAEESPARAAEFWRRSLELHHQLGDRWRTASTLEGLARWCAATGEAARGARLLGAAEALRREIGAPVPPVERPALERARAALHEALGDGFATLVRDGAGAPLAQVVALAVGRETGEGRARRGA
jgi:non-specific serine/threonine protein kinase